MGLFDQRLPKGARAAAFAATLLLGVGDAARAQETSLFEDMPTGALLELYAEVGAALRSRGVFEGAPLEEQIYAELLFQRALELADHAAVDDLVIIGVRESDAGAARRGEVTVPTPGEDAFANLGVIVFQYDFQPIRGVLATRDAVTSAADGDGQIQLNDAFWRADGVEDMTARLYQAAAGL